MRIQPISNVRDESNLRTTINQIGKQVSDITGSITLGAGTSSTVNNTKVISVSVISLIPRSEGALDARAFVSSISNGTFTIEHKANSGATFDYIIIGSA